jgi:hypothetical protein
MFSQVWCGQIFGEVRVQKKSSCINMHFFLEGQVLIKKTRWKLEFREHKNCWEGKEIT